MSYLTQKSKEATKRAIVAYMPPFYRKRDREEKEKALRSRWQSFGVEVTNICNANCSFCAYGKNVDKRKKDSVSYEVLKYALDLYEKVGGGNFLFTSTLGDPFTDKNLLEKIKLVKSYPSIGGITIYTNLIGLDNFNIRDFVRSGITGMAISATIGDSNMYKKLYGVDKYDKVVDNIINVLRVNEEFNRPIRIKLLIRIDHDFLPQLEAKKEFKEIRKYLSWNQIRVLSRKEWDDYNKVIKISNLPKGGRFVKNIKNKKAPCAALYRKLQILQNGDISVCACRISPELVIDNIFNYTSLYDHWRGEKRESFRKRWLAGDIPSTCKGCTHYQPYTDIIKSAVMREVYQRLKKRFSWGIGKYKITVFHAL